MEFYTVSSQPRPVRLSPETRQFAWDSLHHKYGKDTEKVPAAVMDSIPDFTQKTDLEQYDLCISEICKTAPLRLCPGELLSGAATLGQSIHHNVPATLGGEIVFCSVSHLTIDFEYALKYGVNQIEEDVKKRQADPSLTSRQRDFLRSCLHCIAQMRLWHGRYLSALEKMPEYAENYRNLQQVPFLPARSFYEAVQCIWFVFAFVRLCGNWPGIGRLDLLLGDYLKKDLADGTLTLDRAREILAHFFIKGCEWVKGGVYGSGDAQHYQNIVLAGIDPHGREVTNEVTYLVLDVLEELNISDFPTSVRLNSHSPEPLLRRVAEVMKHGGGVLAIYNEEKVIESLVSVGYPLQDARSFANDGCWEVQAPGRSYFIYAPLDGLGMLLNKVLKVNGEGADFATFDDLRKAYYEVLERDIVSMREARSDYFARRTPEGGWAFRSHTPCTAVSLFERGCIENAASYREGGPEYHMFSPHLGGAADVGNSLRVIDKLCYRDKILTLPEFINILKNNWQDHEPLRQYVLNKISFYGNDDDEADAYTAEVVDTFAETVLRNNKDAPYLYVPGISTFGRQIGWRYKRPASPHGHRTGDILAPNMGATPGSDLQGVTALIKSYCKLDLKKQVSGAALDVKLLPSAVRGKDGTEALVGLMRGFVALGGCFMQPDVVDNALLKEAQVHPEQYSSLSVRVSGWNARFVTLSKEWQDMVIEKTGGGEI